MPRRQFRPRLESLEERYLLATYTVTSTLDSGTGSLRQAILNANGDAITDVIQFNLAGPGVQTIAPAAPLPPITNPVIIDGYSQPGASVNTLPNGNNAVLLIELDGTSAGANASGLVVSAGNSTIRGLVINRFQGAGIELQTGGNSTITGNFVGTDSTGTSALGNGGDGIRIDASFNNTVGGTTTGAGNLLAGNSGNGLTLVDHADLQQAFAPGTNDAGGLTLTPEGTAAGFTLSTFADGFTPDPFTPTVGPLGMAFTDSGGVLVSDQSGFVRLFQTDTDNQAASSVTQQHAYGDRSANGLAQVGSTIYMAQNLSATPGILQINQDTTPGQPLVSDPVLLHAAGLVASPANGHLFVSTGVSQNIYEIDPRATSPTPVFFAALTHPDGLAISSDGHTLYVADQDMTDASNNIIGGHLVAYDVATRSRVLSFPSTQITGLDGIALGTGSLSGFLFANTTDGNVIQINLADPTQQVTIASGGSRGDFVTVDPNNGSLLLTQTDRIERLVPPVGSQFVSSTHHNVIQGNFIGTNLSGGAALANALDGIDVLAGASFNVIGSDNVISGNGQEGIKLSDQATRSNAIQGNLIGLNAQGTAALGNGRHGIAIVAGAASNLVGQGNTISGNSRSGIYVNGTATTDNSIQGNFIGTDPAGTVVFANGIPGDPAFDNQGVKIDDAFGNTVGGTAVGSGNVIAGNSGDGVLLTAGASANAVQGNFIGTNAASAAGLGNVLDGIRIDASFSNSIGGAAGGGNVISGNGGNGITLVDHAEVTQSFTPGTNDPGGLTLTPEGMAAGFTLSTFADGFTTDASSPTIGPLGIGFPTSGVLVSDYPGHVRLFPSDTDNQHLASVTQDHSYALRDAFGLAKVGNTFYMAQRASGNIIQLNPDGSPGQTIVSSLKGPAAVAANPVNGHLFVSTLGDNKILEIDPQAATPTANLFVNATDPDGLAISSDGRTLYAALKSLPDGGHLFAYDIATKKATDLGQITGIDGTALGSGPLAGFIFANTNDGRVIEISLADPTQKVTIASGGSRGDFVTVDPGTRSLLLTQTDRIERLTPTAGTGFGGNTYNNVIQGNFIGTNASGSAALANTQNGIDVHGGAFQNTIGAGNVISGNTQDGIRIADLGSSANTVQGNFIGLNAQGAAALGNGRHGVELDGGVANNLIGSGNTISGNKGSGIFLNGTTTTKNRVEGNFIGTDLTGALPLGNGGPGVDISSASSNAIGGTAAGAGNVIAFNNLQGVLVETGTSNSIWHNAIFSNQGLGIDLGNDGVTANDTGTPPDQDTGANNLQNTPILHLAVPANGTTFVGGTLNSTPSRSFALDFFSNASADPSGSGEGQTYLTTSTVITDGSGNASFSVDLLTIVPTGILITATATAVSTGDTSEFSQGRVVAVNDPPTASSGGPYTITEGDSLTLAASGSDPEGDPLSFTWDVNGDGQFVDATGANPTLTWNELNALGISDGPGTFAVAVQVSDGLHTITSATTTLTLTNAAPTPAIGGASTSSPKGVAIALTATATDPSFADTSADFTYSWDVTRNGTSFASDTTTNFSFTPDAAGAYLVSLTATDKDGGSGTISRTITVLPSIAETPTHLAVAAPLQVTAGKPLGLIVDVLNSTSQLVSVYQGTIHFTSTDADAVLPADYTFTSADSGAHTFAVALPNAGNFTITAVDVANPTVTGKATVQTTKANAIPPSNLVALATQFTHSQEHIKSFLTQAYNQFVNRNPRADEFKFFLDNVGSGAQFTDEHIEALFIGAPEYIQSKGGTDVQWILSMYTDLLFRQPQLAELGYWLGRLDQLRQLHAADPGFNVHVQAAEEFDTSEEREGYRIQANYQTYLNRQGDTKEVSYWIYQFTRNRQTSEDLAAGFVASSEYFNSGFKSYGDRSAWVQAAYRDVLGREAQPDEVTYWLNQMK